MLFRRDNASPQIEMQICPTIAERIALEVIVKDMNRNIESRVTEQVRA